MSTYLNILWQCLLNDVHVKQMWCVLYHFCLAKKKNCLGEKIFRLLVTITLDTPHIFNFWPNSLSDFKTSSNTCMNLWLSLYLQIWTYSRWSIIHVLMNFSECTQNNTYEPNQQKCKNTVLILLPIGKNSFHHYINWNIFNGLNLELMVV